MENQTDKNKKWYQKKRYIIPLVVFVVFIILGSNNNSGSQVQPQTAVNPSYNSFTAPTYNQVQPTTPSNATSNLSNDNFYTNVNNNQVHSPAYSNSVPAGASAQCRDGTYSFSQHRSGTCSHHGGVAQWL